MPREKIQDYTTEGWHAEVSWRRKPLDVATEGSAPGHVQLATVNLFSPFEFPEKETGGHFEAAERFDGWRVTLNEASLDKLIKTLHKAKRQAFGSAAPPRPSALVAHAKRELELCGQAAEDSEYASSIVKAVESFASFGHSGGSAAVAIEQLLALLQFRNLAPLTDDPNDWVDRSQESGEPVWQNRRNSQAFSTDGGKTYWLLSEGASLGHQEPTHRSQPHRANDS